MDKIIARKFYSQKAKLPEEIKIFLESDVFEKILVNIGEKYQIDSALIFELVVDIIIDEFNFSDFEKRILKFFQVDNSVVEKIVIDVLGMIFYPMEFFYDKIKPSLILKKKKVNPEDYDIWVASLENELEKELDLAIDEFDKSLDEINWEEESKLALEIINSQLVEVFRDYSPMGQAEFNRGLALMLINVPEFPKEATKALLLNQEKITSNKIKLNDKIVEPTIANWLKDYNYQFNLSEFSTLNLTKFISSSINCQKLAEKEKSYVARLLQMFLNIKFFPDSLKDQMIENWQIFSLPEVKKEKFSKVINKDIKKEEVVDVSRKVELAGVSQKLANYDWDKIKGLERRALLEELGVSKAEFEKWYKGNSL